MTRRCCVCPTCVARSVSAAARYLRRGRPDLAADIIELLRRDLPDPALRCQPDRDLGTSLRVMQEQLIEARGWARAYEMQQRQRLAAGAGQ